MRKVRGAARDMTIDWSRCDKQRRASCKGKPKKFCLTYFPKVFYNKFVPDQIDLIDDFVSIILYGGLLARADMRGAGKSSLGKVLGGVYAPVYGFTKWFVPIEVNMEEAEETLNDIVGYYTDDSLSPGDLFGGDFPEICQPMRAAADNPQRARGIVVEGKPVKLIMKQRVLVLPKIKDCPASQFRVTPKGAEKPIRGLAKKNVRPDLVWINDVETDETADSEVMTRKIHRNITKGVMGLAGPNKPLGILMTGTIINQKCLIAQFTDRARHPEWNGKRKKFFIEWPTHTDMRDKYLYLLSQDLDEAYKYYTKNKKRIEAGAVVSNPYRFISQKGPKGKPIEVSAIQRAYNAIYGMGMAAFMSEWQNEPQEENIEKDNLEVNDIQKQLTGVERGNVPVGVIDIVSGIDVHARSLVWVILGIVPTTDGGVAGKCIDYGVDLVNAPSVNLSGKMDRKTQLALDLAQTAALNDLRDKFSMGWPDSSGVMRNLGLGIIDSGDFTETIYRWCVANYPLYRPSKGLGTGQRHGGYKVTKSAAGIGMNWYASKHEVNMSPQRKSAIILFNIGVDYWKRHVRSGFILNQDQAGSIALFGTEAYVHGEFARQILAEEWVTEFVTGKGDVSRWKHNRNVPNHFLDALTYARAGYDVLRNVTKPKRAAAESSGVIENVSGSRVIRTRY